MKLKPQLIKEIREVFHSLEGNAVSEAVALAGCAGLAIFEEPLVGFSSAEDSLYEQYKKSDVIGETFMRPGEWLPGAKTVVSFFLPFTDAVRSSNRMEPETISPEWLHGRIEGQNFIISFTKKLKEYFENHGVSACVPATDERFKVIRRNLDPADPEGIHMESAWSERHAAYASGLGTFCLSRGLISEKGVAGRYGSIIISDYVEPDKRPYAGIYDYCTKCGTCISRCPVGAISLEHGKNQLLCSNWIDETKVRHSPRYGCGKCQTGVPCEAGIPFQRHFPKNTANK